MRIRAVDAQGDMVFGGDQAAILRNSPDAVATLAEARLNLWTNQWYLDPSDGTPYETDVLGYRTGDVRDAVLQERILTTQGVSGITAYNSEFDPGPRTFTPTAQVRTIYGASNATAGVTTVHLPVEQDR